jgi:hypothetical protein
MGGEIISLPEFEEVRSGSSENRRNNLGKIQRAMTSDGLSACSMKPGSPRLHQHHPNASNEHTASLAKAYPTG